MKVKVVILFVVAVIICCGSSFAQTANDHIIEGNQLIAQNKIRDAICKFNDALKIEPNNYLAFFGNGMAYEKLYKYDTALYYFRKTVNFKKDFEQAYYKSGVVRYKLKSYTQAVHDFDRVLINNPNNLEARLYLANINFKLGYYNASYNNFNVLYINTDDKSYYLKACLSKLRTNNLIETICDFDTLISKYPEYDSAYLYRGITRLSNKEYKFALDDFSKAIKLNPNLTLAYIYRGRANQILNKNSDYIEDLKNWKILDPDFLEKELEIAYNYYYEMDYNDAVSHFNHIIAVDSTRADIYYFISQCYYNLGNYFQSKDYANLNLKYSKTNIEALLLKGQACFQLCRDKLNSQKDKSTVVINDLSVEGIKSAFQVVFDKIKKYDNNKYDDSTYMVINLILNNDSLNYNAYLLKGDILREKKLYDSSLKQYNRAIEISDESNCIYKRALLYFEMRNYEAALPDVEKLIKLDEYSLDLKIIRAILKQYIPNKDSESHKEFQILFEDEINRAEVYVLKGYYTMTYQHLYQNAILDFDKALEIDHFNSKAKLYRSQAKNILGNN
ncbi:MAG: tetratricopeptide repeat protein [Candidatus Kapabacteria bacterium]|nr:tetratricopeptide repeat protein [Candidatus Kapabacteria bacterium]